MGSNNEKKSPVFQVITGGRESQDRKSALAEADSLLNEARQDLHELTDKVMGILVELGLNPAHIIDDRGTKKILINGQVLSQREYVDRLLSLGTSN